MTRQGGKLIGIVGLALACGSGCASRGFVRNQVGTSAETLSAGIEENRTQIEETQQGLSSLRANSNEVHTRQDLQLRENQEGVEAARNEVAAVQDTADDARRSAHAASEQGQTLSRLFEDRSRFEVRVRHEILFGFDKAEIGEQHHQELEAIAAMLMADPNAVLVLEGRTDSLGDADYNTRLAQRRIEAARTYLVMEMGVPIYRIHGFSYGESQPAHDNESRESRAMNRSLTAVVLGPPSEVAIATVSPE